MLQALTTKPIEPKAAPKPAVSSTEKRATKKSSDLESKIEEDDFANELEAANAAESEQVSEPKVKAVKVSAEQMLENPSSLIKLPESNPDAVSPKVFDPALTQGVDSIIQPKTTEVAVPVEGAPIELTNEQVMKLAEGQVSEVDAEIQQAMLKTPQVQEGGRAPALDMAKGEIDPQLLNMDDFVAQKNLAVKKSMNNASAYGMPNKAQAVKANALESGLNSTQTINEIGAKSADAGTSGSSMNSQQFILSAQADLSSNAKVNEHASVKTFNMNHVKTDNPNQIMTQITDYIVQAKAAKEPTVNMRVNHEELGMIDITVQKTMMGQDSIAVNIATHSADGKNFFQANSKDLFSHLTTSGLNISDLKVETPTQTAKSDFDFGSQSGSKGQAGSDKQFGSEQNQRKHDSDRRQDLWNLLSNKEAA